MLARRAFTFWMAGLDLQKASALDLNGTARAPRHFHKRLTAMKDSNEACPAVIRSIAIFIRAACIGWRPGGKRQGLVQGQNS